MSAPGWHPDPHVPGQLRWWDGAVWTTHVAIAAAGAPTAAAPATAPAPAPVPPIQPGQPGWTAAPGGPGMPVTPGTGPGSYTPPKGNGSTVALLVGAGILAVVVVIGAVALLGTSSKPAAAPATIIAPSTTRGPTASVPRPSVTDDRDDPLGSTFDERAEIAQVPILDEEGAATHTHTLLKISVDGDQIVIPAGVGIDGAGGRIAALHTHEDRGVLHVESPTRGDTYTLEQFLALWGAGSTEDEICQNVVEGPCTVAITVVAPSSADQAEFEDLGPMDDEPPVAADGLDTLLAQGLVIELAITGT